MSRTVETNILIYKSVVQWPTRCIDFFSVFFGLFQLTKIISVFYRAFIGNKSAMLHINKQTPNYANTRNLIDYGDRFIIVLNSSGNRRMTLTTTNAEIIVLRDSLKARDSRLENSSPGNILFMSTVQTFLRLVAALAPLSSFLGICLG